MTHSEYKRHLFEYRHDGAEWGIEIFAASKEDAKARLRSLAFARYEGEVAAKIAIPGAGLIHRIVSRFR